MAKKIKCFYGNAKIWHALGDYPSDILFNRQSRGLHQLQEIQEWRRLHGEARGNMPVGEVKLTPVERMVEQRESEPTYGDF